MGSARAVRIYKSYGADAIQVISEGPCRLARDIRGIGFKTADSLAMKLGIEKTAMIRARAGIAFALTEALDEGHCGLPRDDLLPLAVMLLEIPDRIVLDALRLELDAGQVIRRSGRRARLRLPRRPLSRRALDRRSAENSFARIAALEIHRCPEGHPVGGSTHWPGAYRQPEDGDPRRAALESDGDHRRPWCRQDQSRRSRQADQNLAIRYCCGHFSLPD
jgi:Helix-hairpin-helix containing domain